MQEKSIFKQWWFWMLLIGIFSILVAALLHLGLKENTQWVWIIFGIGALLAVLGIIFALVSYFTQPRCVVANTKTDTFGCENVNMNKMSTQIPTPIPVVSPGCSPMRQPSMATQNLPQAQRGFMSTSNDLSALAP